MCEDTIKTTMNRLIDQIEETETQMDAKQMLYKMANTDRCSEYSDILESASLEIECRNLEKLKQIQRIKDVKIVL